MPFILVLFIFVFVVNENLLAKPKEELTAIDVCSSIRSSKYISQCQQAIYKAYYFDPKAIKVCFEIKSDVEKKTCMSIIRNKEYTKEAVQECLSVKKHLLTKCLQKNGTEKSMQREESQPSSSVD